MKPGNKSNFGNRLTQEDIDQAFKWQEEGISRYKIAKRLGVTWRTINWHFRLRRPTPPPQPVVEIAPGMPIVPKHLRPICNQCWINPVAHHSGTLIDRCKPCYNKDAEIPIDDI